MILSKVHRFFIIFGEISCAILYIITGFCTNFVGSIFCMCLLRFIYGCFGSCYVVLEIDMAGEYAGLVHGLATSIMVVGYVVNPLLMSWMVKNHNSSGWSRYFMLLSILNIWAAVIFSFFGSGKPESWSTVEEESTHVELEDIKKNCENNKNT